MAAFIRFGLFSARFRLLLPVTALLLSACAAPLPDHDTRARSLFCSGAFRAAADALDPELTPDSEGGDRLLFLMDRGVILHAAARYPESNAYFLKAGRLAERIDYVSLTEEAAKIITNEQAGVYRGEDFERVLIHTYLAMNFAVMGLREDALVECRLANHELELIARHRKSEYKQNPFAVYLSALLYEAEDLPNDAYVDCKRARALMPGYAPLLDDLLRLSHRLGIRDEFEDWRRQAGGEWRPPEGPPPGEVVVLFECGLAPRKVPEPKMEMLPKFEPALCLTSTASVRAADRSAETAVMDDVEATLMKSLDSRMAGLAAKRLLSATAKEVAAYQLARRDKKHKSDIFWLLTFLILSAERPDLRSWETLPKSLQLARLAIPPGIHEVVVQPRGPGGAPMGPEIRFAGVKVRPGERVFLNCRTIR